MIGIMTGTSITIVVLVVLLFAVLFWYICNSSREKRLWEEVREAEEAIHKAFDLLKEDVREQLEKLDGVRTKRQLAEKEEKIINQLKKDLDDAERFVRKEIGDIEKEVR